MNAQELTTLLELAQRGDKAAENKVYSLAYSRLHKIASRYARGGNASPMQPATLLHEAYLKAYGGDAALQVHNSAHFYRLLAAAMRQIIIDLTRKNATAKHGNGALRIDIDTSVLNQPDRSNDLLEIDDAVNSLTQIDPQLGELVELHFFGGLSFAEIAELRGTTERTVQRHWRTAKTLIAQFLTGEG